MASSNDRPDTAIDTKSGRELPPREGSSLGPPTDGRWPTSAAVAHAIVGLPTAKARWNLAYGWP